MNLQEMEELMAGDPTEPAPAHGQQLISSASGVPAAGEVVSAAAAAAGLSTEEVELIRSYI